MSFMHPRRPEKRGPETPDPSAACPLRVVYGIFIDGEKRIVRRGLKILITVPYNANKS